MTGEDRWEQVRDRSEQVRTGPDRSGQIRTGQESQNGTRQVRINLSSLENNLKTIGLSFWK